MTKLRKGGWVKPSEVYGLRSWFFRIWCDWEKWHWGMKPDGIRILGFHIIVI